MNDKVRAAISGSCEPDPSFTGSGPAGFDPGRKERAVYSHVDDEETRAFIDGWNAALLGEDDFDLALHFWNRRRCGI